MFRKTLITTVATGAFMFGSSFASAADQAQDRTRTEQQAMEQTQERIYGSELMTEQERNEYRDRIRAATSEQERKQIRAEHHERMKARAKERGVVLPEEPPAKGKGMMAPGGGMGPGSGSGPRGGGMGGY